MGQVTITITATPKAATASVCIGSIESAIGEYRYIEGEGETATPDWDDLVRDPEFDGEVIDDLVMSAMDLAETADADAALGTPDS